MTKFELIKSWDINQLAHFISSITRICKNSDELDCSLCDHSGDALCNKVSCTKWLESEVEG